MFPQEYLRNDEFSEHLIRWYMKLIYPINGNINFDHLIKVLFARIFHCKVNLQGFYIY